MRNLGALVLATGLLILTGCSPQGVEVLTVDGPDRLETGDSGSFSAAANEDAKPPVTYTWSFDDGATADGPAMTRSFDEAGAYGYTVTASNAKGKFTVSESGSVTVTDPPVPAQLIALLASSTSVDTQTPVEFSANVRGDAPLSYAWSFGDGTTSTDPRPVRVFMEAGSYGVSLELSNAHGRDDRSVTINVSAYEAAYCQDLAEMNVAFFERNGSVLTDAGQQALMDNLDILNECPNLNVRVEGMASPFERNGMELSEDRARAVKDFYTAQGIAGRRVLTVGLGQASGTSKKSGADQFQRADTVPLR